MSLQYRLVCTYQKREKGGQRTTGIETTNTGQIKKDGNSCSIDVLNSYLNFPWLPKKCHIQSGCYCLSVATIGCFLE